MENDRTELIQFMQRTISMENGMANKIAQNFQPKKLMKGDFLVQEGKVSNEYLFIERGYLRAFLLDTEGNEVTVQFHSPQTVAFEVSSFFNALLHRKIYRRLRK